MQATFRPLAVAMFAVCSTFALAQQAPADATRTLGEVTVKDTADVGYAAKRASSGTKSDTPLLDTPMAIQVISGEVLQDQNSVSVQEAVKNVSGTQATNQFYDQFLLRGFSATRFRNGLQLTNVYGGENMAFIDHIEVAKGPASMLYGRIEPGGLVNVITKEPQAVTAFSVEQQVGSWGSLRTIGDATGKLNSDGSLLYRLMGVYDKGDSFIDNVHHRNDAVAAALAWKPNARFVLNLQLEHYDTKMAEVFMGMGGQVPVIGNRPSDLTRHFSSLDPVIWSGFPMKINRTLYAFDWSYVFDDRWKLTQRFSFVDHMETQSILYSFFDGIDTLGDFSLSYQPDWKRKTYNSNLDLTGEISTGDVRHKLLVGLDWYKASNDEPGSDGLVAGMQTLNIYHPVFGSNVALLQATINADRGNVMWRSYDKALGVYLQDQISLDKRWDLLLGVRHDQADQSYSETYGTRATSYGPAASCYPVCTGYPLIEPPTDKADSPHLGLLYNLSNDASLYGSYAKSFGMSLPPAYSFANTKLGPEIGIQYEIGAKANWLGGRLTTSATLFDLYKRNVIQSDPVHLGYMISVGEIRSRGLEFDASGQISDHLSLIASFTRDDAIITKDVSPFGNTQGNKMAGVPLNAASVWAKYDTAPAAAEGWEFGAGAYLNGQRQGDNANSFQLPGYVRVDAMVAYRMKAGASKVTAQVNANNLLDKTYFDSAGTAGGSTGGFYGAPRNLTASVKLEF